MLVPGEENAEVKRMPLVDSTGSPIELATVVGNTRANMRFGRDTFGNLYLASKANGKVYRLQGTPDLRVSVAGIVRGQANDERYAEIALIRPPLDDSISYELQVSNDLREGFTAVPADDFEIVSTSLLDNGMEKIVFRYRKPIDADVARFFRFSWTNH